MRKENSDGMNILFTLCGRAGSKGVRGKNVRDFNGVPLAWLSLAVMSLYKERFLKEEDTVRVVVNTDSDILISIAESAKDIPVSVIRREENLSGDRIPKVAAIMDCLKRMEAMYHETYDVLIDLDITSPLRTVEDVKNAVETLLADPNMDAVLSVTPSRRNPMFNIVALRDGYQHRAIETDFIARQQAPEYFDVNASIYAYRPSSLKTRDPVTFFDDHTGISVMFDTGVLDIDSEDDYEMMQVIAGYLYEAKPEFREIYKKAESWK